MQAPGDLCLKDTILNHMGSVQKMMKQLFPHLHLIKSSASPFVLQRNVSHFPCVPFPSEILDLILSIFLRLLFLSFLKALLLWHFSITFSFLCTVAWIAVIEHNPLVCINYWDPFAPCKNGLKSTAGHVCWKYTDGSHRRKWPDEHGCGRGKRKRS